MSIESHQFASGLQVYATELPHANTTSVNFIVKAGSLDEAEHEAGLSHLIEHVVHHGTTLFPNNQARLDYEEEHMYGSQANTGMERTHYFARGSEGATILQGLGSLVFDAELASHDIDHEIDVVTREAKMQADTQGWRFFFAASQAMVKSPYSRPLIGYTDALDFDPESVRDFHSRLYVPANVAVVTVGRLCLDETVQKLREHWPSLDGASSAEATHLNRPDPVFQEPGIFWFPDSINESNTYISVRVPLTGDIAQSVVANNDYSYTIARQVIGSEVSKELRDERRLSYDGYFTYRSNWHPKMWIMEASVTVDTGREEEALSVIEKAVQGSCDVSENTILRKIRANLGQIYSCGDDINSLASALVGDIANDYPPISNEQYVSLYKTLPADKIRDAIADLSQQFVVNPRYVMMGAAESPLPEAQEIQPRLTLK